MPFSGQYRQQVTEFREELARILTKKPKPGDPRLIVDGPGHKTRMVRSKSDEHRMQIYGYERFESVARSLCIFQLLREHDHLDKRKRKVQPTPSGAVWQAFRGTEEYNACHTCPTHLQLNGTLPTNLTKNIGLKRHIILEFANCIQMPRSINEVDIVFDEDAGKSSFVEAAYVVLNESGASWREGVEVFREGVRGFLSPAYDVLFNPAQRNFVAERPEDQQRIDMLASYYEGMFLTMLNDSSIESLMNQAKNELGKNSTEPSM